MAPGLLLDESPPSKRLKTSAAPDLQNDDEDVAIALPSHPLGIKPAGNAYTASENIKSRCGSFAMLPDELLSHIFESFDADTLIRLGSTCRALYAFTRLDELWRALFVRYVTYHGTLHSRTHAFFLCFSCHRFESRKRDGTPRSSTKEGYRNIEAIPDSIFGFAAGQGPSSVTSEESERDMSVGLDDDHCETSAWMAHCLPGTGLRVVETPRSSRLWYRITVSCLAEVTIKRLDSFGHVSL
jgi:hypothetical protein